MIGFSWAAWPTATAQEVWSNVPHSEYRAAGKPRIWKASQTSALWRSFPDYSSTPQGRVRFFRRHGDPSGVLNQIDRNGVFKDRTLDLSWDAYAKLFTLISQNWTPLDHDGTSHRGKADGLARDLVDQLGASIEPALLPVSFDQRSGWLIKPQTLFAFMGFSAVDNWIKSTPHRQCGQCNDWFVVRDKRSRFCSNACATAHRRNKKETSHGEEAA